MVSRLISRKMVAGVFAAAAVVLPLVPAAGARAYSTDPDADYSKVYVCKYVGTPGQDERLQTGQNPINVSVNAIRDFQGIGSWFNDQHGRSYVVAWDNGDKVEPPLSMCGGETQPTTIEIPAEPAVNDPCGAGNAQWVVPTDTTEVTWELDAAGNLIAYVAADDATFTDGTTSHTYGLAVDSAVACPVTPPNPPSGGNVLGTQTTAQPTVQKPAATLVDTGVSSAVTTVLSAALIALALTTVMQNTARGSRVAQAVRNTVSQPFVIPTL